MGNGVKDVGKDCVKERRGVARVCMCVCDGMILLSYSIESTFSHGSADCSLSSLLVPRIQSITVRLNHGFQTRRPHNARYSRLKRILKTPWVSSVFPKPIGPIMI